MWDPFWSLPRLSAIFTLGTHGARHWPMWKSRGKLGNDCPRPGHHCRGTVWGSAHTTKYPEGREQVRGEGAEKGKWPWKDPSVPPTGRRHECGPFCFLLLIGWIKTAARSHAKSVQFHPPLIGSAQFYHPVWLGGSYGNPTLTIPLFLANAATPAIFNNAQAPEQSPPRKCPAKKNHSPRCPPDKLPHPPDKVCHIVPAAKPVRKFMPQTRNRAIFYTAASAWAAILYHVPEYFHHQAAH